MSDKSFSRGGVSATLSTLGLAEGWDIQSIAVRGVPVPPVRCGEFATLEEAEQAALDRAREFAKSQGLKVD